MKKPKVKASVRAQPRARSKSPKALPFPSTPTTQGLPITKVPPGGLYKPFLTLPTASTPVPPGALAPANPALLACAPPSTRTGPAFEVHFRRPILLTSAGDKITLAADVNKALQATLTIAGVSFTLRDIYFALDARFLQTWNLTDVTIGDLSSTMSLAPREQVTVEVIKSQRKTLDQSTLDSTDSISTTESTMSDKEAVNVARSASKTEGWHVDGSASISVGTAKVGVNAGYSKNTTESNQQTINHVTEATKKSATNLKTTHKIEVRGVTETFVENRMTRNFQNPYYDRTMSINVFQLLKQFSIETDIDELRGAFVYQLDSMEFDNSFVINHLDFLKSTLIDSSLVDALPSAIAGAMPLIQTGARDTAIQMSKLALRYLYNLPTVGKSDPANMLSLMTGPAGGDDQNDPQTSFKLETALKSGDSQSGLSWSDILLGVFTGGASLTAQGLEDAYKQFIQNEKQIIWSSGFDTAVRSKAAGIFATLAFFNMIVQATTTLDNGTAVGVLDYADNAILLASALAADLDTQWSLLFPDPIHSDSLQAMMSSKNYTEVFRRVPGFTAMIREIVKPLVDPAAADSQAIAAHNQDLYNLDRLISHLQNYSTFYTEKFLDYVGKSSNGTAIVAFATAAIDATTFPFFVDPNQLDLDRTFINQRDIIIPGVAALADSDLQSIYKTLGGKAETTALPVATVIELEVPCDGVHFEIAEGICRLTNVPTAPEFPAALQDLSVTLK